MNLFEIAQHAIRFGLHRAGAESHPAQLAGRRAHFYTMEGRDPGAPPAVLLHGLGGQANSFSRVMPLLRAGFSKLYVPDLPGHGFAPLENGERPLDAMEHFGAAHEFMDKYVGGPAVIIGNSFGGALALTLAALAPEKVRGLGLISPAGAPMDDAELNEVRKNFRPGAKNGIALVKRMYHRAPPSLVLALLGPSLARHFTNPAVLHVFQTSKADVYVPEQSLAALAMPVLLVWGASEKLLPYGGIDYFRRHLPPHARIVILEKAGHVAQVERPRETARLLLELAAAVRKNTAA
jgi:pimeloyl-ACP methyl ester carboxylesterase